jgi:hypothetical protein
MPYYKFKRNEVYNNTLKTYPSVKFVVYSGSAYYNNTPNISGAFADPIWSYLSICRKEWYSHRL